MIRMYPKALVLTAHHPFGGTEMMAQSLAYALNANGYDARVVNVSDASLQTLPAGLRDPDLGLVMTTGTLPLGVRVDGQPVWRAMREGARFVTYVVDAWPYDAIRVPPFVEFLGDWRAGRPGLHLASLEGYDARLIGAHHMPTGAYPAPWRDGPKRHGERLMVWASAHKELALSPVGEGFAQTLRDNNPWGFDAARIARIDDVLRHTDVVHGLSAVADAFGMPLPELARDAWLPAIATMDSCLKRYRRTKVVLALREFPLDIYGENWGPYVANHRDARVLVPEPNHNHVFSYVVQHYAGLVNFDPNFGDGTNERAVSALAMGVPIANNFNARTDGVPGVHAYHFSDDSIRRAAERVLAHRDPVPTPLDNTWEWRVGGLLRAIAAEPAGARAATSASSPARDAAVAPVPARQGADRPPVASAPSAEPARRPAASLISTSVRGAVPVAARRVPLEAGTDRG